ncbi:enzymatic polyprotein endonuclease reverse [Vespula maculifrons]|uniref:Enzymatic polyprotein endonuclease reverse n=1 Tax=Vespula maculifrons TaxID=7453 RepID=A0ABD2BQ80_VESMC
MSSDRTNQNQPKLADKIETRSDAEIEDITFRLRQKELFLQERERTIREREEILRSDTAKPDLAKLETMLREIVTTRHQTDDAFYDSFESYNISIREAINMVPQYDGYSISIGTFTRACKRARELILFNAEETATRLIIKKLRGQVYSIVKDYNIYSIDRLCDILWENLYTQYKVELSSIYMDQDEHIFEFIDRVKDLRQVICNEERYKSHELTEEKRKEIDEFILISFCHGLPLEYRLKITPDTCEDLLDAFVKARKFYAEIKLDRLRYQEYQQPQDFRDRPTTSNCDKTGIKNRNTRAINSNPAPKSCTYCNKLGHNKDECYKRKRKQQIRSEESLRRDYPFPLPAPPHRFQSNSHGPRKECRYCKNMGHTIEECRKKLWQDKSSGNANIPPRKDATSEANQQQRPIATDVQSMSHFFGRYRFKELKARNNILSRHGFRTQLTLGRVKVTKRNEKHFIALPVKERILALMQLEILDEHDGYRHFGESVRQNLNGHRRSFAHYCNGKQLDSNYSRSFNEIFISHIITTSFFERGSRRFYKTCHLSFWRTQRIECEVPNLQSINSTIFIQIVTNIRLQEYLYPVTYHQLCQQLHTTGSLSLGANIFLSRLKKNNTDTRILTLSGTVPRMVPAKDLDIATHMAPGTTYDIAVLTSTISLRRTSGKIDPYSADGRYHKMYSRTASTRKRAFVSIYSSRRNGLFSNVKTRIYGNCSIGSHSFNQMSCNRSKNTANRRLLQRTT